MKIKGISFFEQHVEKLVLGVAVLLFLGFAGWQVLHQPNLVQVGRDEVAPGQINEILEAKAIEKQARLDAAAPAAIDLKDPVRATDIFQRRLTGGVTPTDRLAQVTPGLSPQLEIVEQADKEFVVPDIHAPTEAVAMAYADGLRDEVVAEYGAALGVDPGRPADMFWTTAMAQFDMTPVLDQLASGGTASDGRALAPVPRTFYGVGLEIFGVEVQREEKVGDAWTGLTTLDPIPGQYTVLNDLPDSIDASYRDDLRRELAVEANQSALLRPAFYATKNNSWTAPRVIEETAEADGEMTEESRRERVLRQQIPLLQQQLADLGKQAAELADELGAQAPPESGGGLGGGGGGGGGGPSGSGNQLGSGGFKGKRDNEKDIKAMRQQLESLRSRIRKLQAQLDARQREFQDIVGERMEDDAARRAAAEEANKGLFTIWAHDVTAVPGKTYRYRMRVRIYNPFFARKLNLIPSQAYLADELTLASDFSEWSNPVKVQTPLEFFVTDASTTGGIGLQAGPRATFEVYRFYDGVWRQEKFTARPGDRIGERREPRRGRTGPAIDYGTDWFVLDIVEEWRGDARGASVLLQNIQTGEVSPLRNPRMEEASSQRALLELEAAQAADAAATPPAAGSEAP